MKKFSILLTLLIFASSIFAQETLKLDKAISIALQRNSGLIKSKESLKINEADVLSSYGDLLPSLSASAGVSWNKARGNETTPTYDPNVDTETWSSRVGGNVTLFNGLANYRNISNSKSSLEASKFTLDKLKQDIVLQTTVFYYNILNATELLKVREENVKYNQKLLEQIEERNKLGSVPVADVYTQRVQLGNAQLLLINAENALEVAKTDFLDYLALDVLEEYTYVDPYDDFESMDLDAIVGDFGSLERMMANALASRNDYKSQKLEVDVNKNNVCISRSTYLPVLTGDYFLSSGAATGSGGLYDNYNYGAGLTLSWTIFNNFNREYNIEASKVNLFNSEEDLRALERAIKIEVKQGYLDFVAAKKALDVSMANVTSALENRKISNERYSLGAGTILDVLQADRDYQEALSNIIDAKYNFFRSRDNLLNRLGRLDSKSFE